MTANMANLCWKIPAGKFLQEVKRRYLEKIAIIGNVDTFTLGCGTSSTSSALHLECSLPPFDGCIISGAADQLHLHQAVQGP